MRKCTPVFTRLFAPCVGVFVILVSVMQVEAKIRVALESIQERVVPTCDDTCDQLARRLTPYLPPVGTAGATPLNNQNLITPTLPSAPTLIIPRSITPQAIPKIPAIRPQRVTPARPAEPARQIKRQSGDLKCNLAALSHGSIR